MSPSLPLVFAQALDYSIGQWVIIAIVIAAVIGIGVVVIRQMGVTLPAWLIQIFWILLAAFVGIVAIRFLLRAAGLF